MQKTILTGLLPGEIAGLLPRGKENYRGMQIFRWIHERGAESFEEMTNLSKGFREEIAGLFAIGALKPLEIRKSSDGSTDKYVWELADGNRIESVIIRDDDRVTACISSQAGCKMGCHFCRTGEMRFTRNLTAGEIVDQLIRMRRTLQDSGEDITNIVFMGMGEPLDNPEAVLKAVSIINMETALSIGQRKVTLSTCGVVPGMLMLAGEHRKVGLAISLNATTDELRSRLMPINKKYPLRELLDAAREFVRRTKRRVTFEYILMEGVNDSPEDARRLLSIVKSVPSKVNLIAYNEYDGSPFKRPSEVRIEAFQRILFEGNVTAILRRSKGGDILAACGQLAAGKAGG
ncbi:MAG: 23S rRNA (adenine(2503)-C(2))-methyltransferase RlmN [Candidatus Latescibacterota bacterium]